MRLVLHRRFGWQIVAMAGLAAVSPDWDGLTLLFGVQLFDTGHRVWGHNLLMCLLGGTLIAAAADQLQLRTHFARRELLLWILVGVVAATSHLAANMVVSGSATLSHWKVQALWPFTDQGWVYPMIPWGDVGATIVFVAGMFAMLGWRERSRRIAWLTLAGVLAYLVLRRTIIH